MAETWRSLLILSICSIMNNLKERHLSYRARLLQAQRERSQPHLYLVSKPNKSKLPKKLPSLRPSQRERLKVRELLQQGGNQQQQQEWEQKDDQLRHDLSQADSQEQKNFVDRQQIKICNVNAKLKYYQHYKKLERVREQNSLANLRSSPFTALLDKSQKLKVLPLCIGLVKESGNRQEIKLSNYKLGDKYAQILSAGFKHCNNNQISQYNFKDNRMTERGANAIIRNIASYAKSIDLSCNLIHRVDEQLLRSLEDQSCQLQYLNLQNNKLGNKSVIALLTKTSKNISVRYLNISKNLLSNEISDSLSTLVLNNSSLRQISVKWNKLTAVGGLLVFQALAKNRSLRVVDFSFNLLGNGIPSCSEQLSETLKHNKVLIHVDLSQNNFSLEESQIIGKGLRKNHTIYGFHFQGNYGVIDSKGFLVFDQQDTYTKRQYKRSSDFKIEGVLMKGSYKRSKFDSELCEQVCWICDGWEQHRFELKEPQQIFLHLSHQLFEGRTMNKSANKHWYLTMVPPGIISYFYTKNKEPFLDIQQTAQAFRQSKVSVRIPAGKNTWVGIVNVPQRNVLQNLPKTIFNSYFETDIRVKPRFRELLIREEEARWSYGISVWAMQWKIEEEQTTRKCFERDWSHSKIPKILKNPQENERVKKLLQNHYINLRNIYKFYSAFAPINDVWAISGQVFVDFCNSTKRIIDNKLPMKFVDLAFITANSSTANEWRGNKNNPERGLVRYQFLQALLRLSDQKYIKNSIHDNFYDSIFSLLEILEPLYEKYDALKWRNSRYFNQENDSLIKKFKSPLQFVFRKNSKLKVKPGQRPFMSTQQFVQICSLSQLLLSGAVQRDCYISYNLSMIVQVDQLESQRIFHMIFIQFVQAFARVCDIANLPSLDSSENSDADSPLCYKLESGLYKMVSKLCSEELKSQFPVPSSSMFDQKKEQVDSD